MSGFGAGVSTIRRLGPFSAPYGVHFAEHWRATAGPLDPRTRDYAALVEEAEQEIQQRLEQEQQEDERENAQ